MVLMYSHGAFAGVVMLVSLGLIANALTSPLRSHMLAAIRAMTHASDHMPQATTHGRTVLNHLVFLSNTNRSQAASILADWGRPSNATSRLCALCCSSLSRASWPTSAVPASNSLSAGSKPSCDDTAPGHAQRSKPVSASIKRSVQPSGASAGTVSAAGGRVPMQGHALPSLDPSTLSAPAAALVC
jgi:hypothetical protein